MSSGTQAKFLRVLEGHPFERVGGHVPIRVDVRTVAATNKSLEEALRAGTFRRDLFFRLQVVEIRVPPLRERKGDIPVLASHFLKRFSRETARKVQGFTSAASAIEVGGPNLPVTSSGEASRTLPSVDNQPPAYHPANLEEIEKEHIRRTLEYTDWNKSQAAAILQIERSTLDRKIKSYDLKK